MRLTPKQIEMLNRAAAATPEGFSVMPSSRAMVTCESLLIKRLLTRSPVGYPSWYVITDVGRAEIARRKAVSDAR